MTAGAREVETAEARGAGIGTGAEGAGARREERGGDNNEAGSRALTSDQAESMKGLKGYFEVGVKGGM